MDWRSGILTVIPLISFSLPVSTSARMRWAVYYSDQAGPEEFRDYGLVVLDSDHHPPIAPLVARGATVLGYLSVGEINQYRAGFAAVKQMGILLGENPNWGGSY